jgi:2-oxo-4-hydroxy-4-carboxy-5-ureidoimidazoline decarboxylase
MTLEALYNLPRSALVEALYHCCGSRTWVAEMLAILPVADKEALFDIAADTWQACSESDWLEAFAHHPKIGAKTTNPTAAAEQSEARLASTDTLEALAEGNKRYEEKFGYIYIVCATGRSASEMLDILKTRLNNTPEKEILIAMSEQEKITRIRLEKLLAAEK